MSYTRRELHLNAFLMEAGHHEAAWRLPESNPRADFDLQHWIGLARLAESAKFDSLFLADGPAFFGTGEFRPPGQLEPLTLLTALAQWTERIGLIATVSTTYNEPYNLARRLASVDHVTGGRAGWNIVTSAGASEAANFGLAQRPGHAERYARADEFLRVAKALWDSWETEAIVADKESGRWGDPARFHRIDHDGQHFKVAGPLNVQRPPQGYPLLVQAGSSEDGKDFAARYAEAIFTAHQTYERAADFYADIKARAAKAGRDPGSVLVLPGIVPFIGETQARAQELAAQFDELRVPEYGLHQLAQVFELEPSDFDLDGPLPDHVLARPKLEGSQSRADLIIELAARENLTVREVLARLGGGRGHFTVAGLPEQVASTIIDWFEGGAADGFNVMAPALPSGLQAFIDHVLPILRGKGLFREEYQGTTLREHYGLHPSALAAPACRLDRLFLCSASRRGMDGTLLGGDRLGDDVAASHLVDVRVHQAGDQGLAEAEAGVHGGDLPVARDGVGREQDAGRMRQDHLLHDHGHATLAPTAKTASSAAMSPSVHPAPPGRVRLVAGPGVYICAECIGLCNEISPATRTAE